MNQLDYLKKFDNFVKECYPMLNESLNDGSQSIINQAFIKRPPIKLTNGETIYPKQIVKAVSDAINYLADDFHRTFQFVSRINIIYLCGNKKCKTMCVDEHMNMYMDAIFIYHTLKMDKELIGAVIMHEVFHILFNHIERGKNWLGSKGLTNTPKLHHDNNLAADVEVNQTLVRLGVIDEERLHNEIHGMYLRNISGEMGFHTNVIPMESILENEKAMEKLRSLCPPDEEQESKDKIKTTPEWDEAYKNAWNKITELVNKYGAEETMNRLTEAGYIDGMGDIISDKFNPEEILKMNLLQVKEYDEFINESNSSTKGYETSEEGFIKGFQDALNKIKSSLNGGDPGRESDDNSPEIESGLKPGDLKDMNLPDEQNQSNSKPSKSKNGQNSSSKQQDDQNNGEQSESESNSSDSESNSNSSGKGSSNNNQDGDVNTLADDLKKKSQSGSSNNSNQSADMDSPMNSGNVGGTGSFIDSSKDNKKMISDMLKESGYSEEDINDIIDSVKKNEERNTAKGIEKARNELRSKLRSSDIISKYLGAIEVESAKYKNVWAEVMEEFLRNKTRRAGNKINDTSINWKRKSRIALGNVGPQYQKVDQDPQDVNLYVDVSGSVDIGLLEVIAKSIVIFSKSYKYSGITICTWASTSNGIFKVENFSKHSEEDITQEILGIVSKGINECGGGTEAHAAISAMVSVCVDTLNDSHKKKKDDVHVIITDGEFDFSNIENKIENSIKKTIDRNDVAERTPEHCFWMIYDAPERLQSEWKKEINRGKLIFINSDTVKGNAKN